MSRGNCSWADADGGEGGGDGVGEGVGEGVGSLVPLLFLDLTMVVPEEEPTSSPFPCLDFLKGFFIVYVKFRGFLWSEIE
ncbi:hypothetical protein A2U01_0068440 [Trifolium medium]|uniref:Uncharacterized protein n=1 Tax=Trifolium medium TaxID=97028 RepID=A0A392SEX3_9FABA|nr:hypothetical protein [Trifolium medium]